MISKRLVSKLSVVLHGHHGGSAVRVNAGREWSDTIHGGPVRKCPQHLVLFPLIAPLDSGMSITT